MLFHPTVYNGCNYLSMLGLQLNHVSKRGPRPLTHLSLDQDHRDPEDIKLKIIFLNERICILTELLFEIILVGMFNQGLIKTMGLLALKIANVLSEPMLIQVSDVFICHCDTKNSYSASWYPGILQLFVIRLYTFTVTGSNSMREKNYQYTHKWTNPSN